MEVALTLQTLMVLGSVLFGAINGKQIVYFSSTLTATESGIFQILENVVL